MKPVDPGSSCNGPSSRSGHLTPIEVPTEEQEAVRTLVRTRLAFLKQILMAKQRIGSLLPREGLVFREGKSYWTRKHRVWLAERRRQLQGPEAIPLGAELDLLEYLETQLQALDAEIDRYAWRAPLQPVADALSCLRGMRTLTAMTRATEIGDIRRFQSQRALMAFAGLVPTEHSSGERERRGAKTKASNIHLRRVLIEAVQNHRLRAGSALVLQRRRQGQPPPIVAIALKAQHRLRRRYWHLALRKHDNVAETAVARELCGLVWALMSAATDPSRQAGHPSAEGQA